MIATIKEHWERTYQTKGPEQLSWTQNTPETSLKLIQELQLPKTASIIDAGGGDSKLASYLLKEGFRDITVLDISKMGMAKAAERMGAAAENIEWIQADISNYEPEKNYDLWHDRAAFHFLTEEKDRRHYVNMVSQHVNRYLILGTFATTGPEKCSGLPVQQYDEASLSALLQESFEKMKCFTEEHITPSGKSQQFLFCVFKKR